MKANKSCDHNLPAINILMQRKKQKEVEAERQRLKKAKEEGATKQKKRASKKSLVEDSEISEQVVGTLQESEAPTTEPPQEPILIDDATIQTETDKEEDSLVVDLIKSKQLEHMKAVQNDPDLEDVEDSSTTSDKPFDINLHDSASIASTLTNKSAETTNSVLTGGSRSTVASDEVTVSTKMTKYGITSGIIEKMAKDGLKNGITAKQLELQVIQYQALKFNEAKLAASAAVARFLQSTNLPLQPDDPQSKETQSQLPQSVAQSNQSPSENGNNLPVDESETPPENQNVNNSSDLSKGVEDSENSSKQNNSSRVEHNHEMEENDEAEDEMNTTQKRKKAKEKAENNSRRQSVRLQSQQHRPAGSLKSGKNT